MKKTLILTVAALLAMVACNKIETPSNDAGKVELSFMPMTGNVATRGFTLKREFQYVEYSSTGAVVGDPTFRDMNISAYLYPQDGEPRNYFVNKSFKHASDGDFWRCGGSAGSDMIFWPVGGTLDFLAYSSIYGGVTASWNADNAASEVVLDVPAESSQDDILFASAYGKEAPHSAAPVPMVFKHAQAWLTFSLGANEGPDNSFIVTLKRIELENVYNAGVLTINNNNGDALATWDFSKETRQDIDVDNDSVSALGHKKQFLHMLIPQQEKTAFVIYYTLGDSDTELSYRFTTDQKTWLMGEHYTYNISITPQEVTVDPTVTPWVKGDASDINAQTDHGVIY